MDGTFGKGKAMNAGRAREIERYCKVNFQVTNEYYEAQGYLEAVEKAERILIPFLKWKPNMRKEALDQWKKES